MVNFFRSSPALDSTPITVIGMGRFGVALGRELTRNGVEVLGVDASEKLVREYERDFSDCVVADSTDVEALRQLGLDDTERVVIAIGSHLEDSILTASNLVEMGVPDIWAKANSDAHARILSQIGVHHVIRPEGDTGRRIAHLLGGRFDNFAEVDVDYGMIKMVVPRQFVGQTMDPHKLWAENQVQIVSVRSSGRVWQPYESDRVFTGSEVIVMAGSPMRLEKFAQGCRS